MRTRFSWFLLFVLLSLEPGLSGAPVPDFKLQDVNPNSLRRETAVSPRDYLFQVSGYYFGAAH